MTETGCTGVCVGNDLSTTGDRRTFLTKAYLLLSARSGPARPDTHGECCVEPPCAHLGILLPVDPSGKFLEVELPGQRECGGGWFTHIAQLPSKNIAASHTPARHLL